MRDIIKALKSGDIKALIASFIYFDTGFSIWLMFGALAPFIAKELKLQPLEKGLLVATPVLSAAIFRISFGLLFQSINGKVIALIGILLSSIPSIIALLFPSLLNNFIILLSLSIFLGFGGASFAIALPMAGSNYPKEYQGLVLGIAAAGNIGAVLDGLLFPSLAKYFGWVNALGMSILLLIFSFIIVFLYAKDKTKKENNIKNYSILVFIGSILFMILSVLFIYSGIIPFLKGKTGIFLLPVLASFFLFLLIPTKYKKVFIERDTWLIMLIYSITFGGFVGMSSYIALYLIDIYHIDKVRAGMFMALFALTGAIIRPLGGHIADKIGGSKL